MESFAIAISLQLVDNATRGLFQATQAVRELAKNVEQTKGKFRELQESIHNFSEKLEDISLKSAQAVAMPLATLTKAMNSFEELEDARVRMEVAFMTKTGLPEELEKITKQVEKLGAELPGATKDFYEMSTALKSGGLSAKDIAGGILEGTAKAWVLFKDEADPRKMADMATKFANAFKIDPKQFTQFIDQLQRLKFASGMELSDIAYSTKYFSNYLQQLGITGMKAVDLMFPLLGTLRQVGLEGETAGTAIAGMFKGIMSFDENVQKLKGVQISLRAKDFMTEEGFKLEEFLIALRQELEKVQDPLKRMQVMKQLFDDEGMRAVSALLAKNKEEALAYLEALKNTMDPEEYQKLRKQIEEGGFTGIEGMRKAMDEQASLQDRINKTMNTWKNVKESFFGTLESLMGVAGSLFAEPLKNIFDTINNNVLGPIIEWIQKNQSLAKAIAYPIAGLAVFGAVIGTVSLVLASFLKLISFSMGILSVVGTVIKALAIAFNVLKGAILFARVAMLSLVAFNPVGLAIIAIVSALAGIAWLLWKNWDRVTRLLTSAWNWLKQNWQRLASFLMSVNPFYQIIVAVNNLVKKLFGVNLFDAGARLVSTLWQGIKSLSNKPVEAFREIVQKIRNMLPFSPAKEGPLRDIHRIRLVETIAESIKPTPLVNAMRHTLQSATGISGKPAMASSGNFHINITINAHSKDVAIELEKQIREVLRRIENEHFRRRY
ncbi:MAG: phage tail tape measure protein [Aquificaceae bacterium]|uniref:phage tail tape measure protein n=1 Tax=Hydrogenobacter sp. Uz 6-8 TaxID=3384828 RepID=UPI0030B757B3